ncbi:hypothetical protein PV326_006489, partial [Microctonus aethiopoides]
TARGSDMYLHLVGTYHNDTLVKITGFTKEPYYAEVGICDGRTVFRIHPLHGYNMMIFTREFSLSRDIINDYIHIDYYSDTVIEIDI